MKIVYHLYINNHYFYVSQSEIKEDTENKQITLNITPFTDINAGILTDDFLTPPNIITIQEREFSPNLGRMSFYLLVNPQLINNSLDDNGNATLVISYSRFIRTDCLESTIRDLKLEELIF